MMRRPTVIEWISIGVGICSIGAANLAIAGIPFRIKAAEVVIVQQTADIRKLQDNDAERKSDVRMVKDATDRIEKALERINEKLERKP